MHHRSGFAWRKWGKNKIIGPDYHLIQIDGVALPKSLVLLLVMGLAHLSLLILESVVYNKDHALADENELD